MYNNNINRNQTIFESIKFLRLSFYAASNSLFGT